MLKSILLLYAPLYHYWWSDQRFKASPGGHQSTTKIPYLDRQSKENLSNPSFKLKNIPIIHH